VVRSASAMTFLECRGSDSNRRASAYEADEGTGLLYPA
jgi:hypothetical protein